MIRHSDPEEEKLKAKKRESKRKLKMNVSGKSVFAIRKEIIKKGSKITKSRKS